MSWLIIAILAYFFLALVALFDRYFLVGPMPNPKVYTFNVGFVWLIAGLLIIPLGVFLPELGYLSLALASGVLRIFAILFLTEGIAKSEVSRIVPANAGLVPIFTFLFFLFYLPAGEILNVSQIAVFLLLVSGSVLISVKFSTKFSFKIFKFPVASAFLFALSFFLTKIVFDKIGFWNGFFWSLMGGAIGIIILLIFSGVRKEIFSQKPLSKTSRLFILGQATGGIGVILQYYAIAVARAGQVPLINAIEGIRFVFLLFFIFLLSRWRPHLLREEIRGAALIQKIIAILIIGAGLLISATKL